QYCDFDVNLINCAALVCIYADKNICPLLAPPGSTSSSLCEHWISRLMGSRPPSQASSGSSRHTSLASLSESTELAGERSEDEGGFSTRPAMRSIQRQTFSLRSNMANPLAVSENSSKPSWSLSAKLHLHSNSPSHFSLESHSSSPTLERIGEAADDKVSTSCFSRSTKPEVKVGGKTPLLVVEGNAGAKRFLDLAGGNNNVATIVEPGNPGRRTVTKEPKQRGVGGGEGAGARRSLAKTVETEKSPKKRPSTPSPTPSHTSSATHVSSPSRTQAKSMAAIASALKEKSEDAVTKTSKTSSAKTVTPSKKEPLQTPETLHPETAKQMKGGSPGSHSCSAHTPRKTSPRGTAERSSASVRTRAAERSASRETSRSTSVSERGLNNGGSSSTASSVSRGVGCLVAPPWPACDRPVWPWHPRGSQRNSKTEEKGVNFCKSALRQKETRKSTDRGKPTTTAQAGTGEAKGSLEEGAGRGTGEGAGDGAAKRAQQGNPEAQTNTPTAKDKESSKTSTPAKHSILSSAKSKSSGSEMGVEERASANGKKPTEKKLLPSRKIPINSTRTPQKPK
uniref:Uncharacterized protein n=1 Tax=Oncorhynchus tshawytscha TaxID=74940 RepID=A0A8C8MGK4_ONCTS